MAYGTVLIDAMQTSSGQVLGAGNATGFKNRIINGSMVVNQRGSVSLTLGSDVYGGCDRTAAGVFSFSTASGTIQQGGSFGSELSTSGYLQRVQLTSTGSGVVRFNQKIESLNTVDLNGKTITIQCGLYQDTGASLNATIYVYKTATQDNWTSATLIGSSSSFAVAGDGITKTTATYTLTLGSNDATNGLMVIVQFSSVGAVTSKSFYIGDFQLELGSTATSFDVRDYGRELIMCQRYFAKTFNQATAPAQNAGTDGSLVGTSSVNNVSFGVSWWFPVTMRSIPTIVTFAPDAASSNWSDQAGSRPTATITSIGQSNAGIRASGSISAGGYYTIHATASIEL